MDSLKDSASGKAQMIRPDFAFFDLDGVLIDSEKLKAHAHVYTCKSIAGIERSPHDYEHVMGKSQSEVIQYLLNQNLLTSDTKKRYDKVFCEEYLRLLDTSLHEMPGATPLLQTLVHNKVRIGVVTSSPRELAEKSLSVLGLRKYIHLMICSEDVVHQKPSPDPYRLAIIKADSDATHSIAIDDTQTGITSAKRAGLVTIGLRHGDNSTQKLSDANYVIGSLLELPNLWQRSPVMSTAE
jgi:HAD superfamily hydrolase (TIGR01509 family)